MGGVAKVIDHFFDISTNLVFRGEYDESEEYQAGDLCIKDGGQYLCTTTSWECISSGSIAYEPSTLKKISYPTNCKNCGAVLHNNICEYCGTDNKEERI